MATWDGARSIRRRARAQDCRINTSYAEGRLSYFDLRYLIGTPEGTEHFVEHHELGLFEQGEMAAAFEGAGLVVSYDKEGLTGRGLYIGRLG